MILSKSQLVNNINTEISDQANGEISPYDIRHNLLDIIDSVHNLTFNQDLRGNNLASLSNGNTKVGLSTFENYETDGSSQVDNTAVGFYALRSNYRGNYNTAIGSNALSCNVHGNNNVGVGYNALSATIAGNFNVGIGNYSLHNLKFGNGNIAIGHGAGYYVSQNESNKFYLAYHPIDSTYICSNPLGNNLTPLLYGDLLNIKLGIGVKTLHDDGILQVGGNICPSGNDEKTLGTAAYNWKTLFLSSSLQFPNFTSINYNSAKTISIEGSLKPSENNIYNLGSASNRWINGYFQDISIDGTAYINNLVSITTETYLNKIIYLNTTTNGNALFSDSNLLNGGLSLKSLTNNRIYSIGFYPSASGMQSFVGDYNKSTWRTNIGLQVPEGSYIKTNSLVSYNPYDTSSFAYGLFFNSGVTYISRNNVLTVNPSSPSGHIAGIGNVNFISNSGDTNNYVFSLLALESGSNVSQRFLSGTKNRIKDISNADKLSGFEIKYIDDYDQNIQGYLTDRLVIGSYNQTSKFINGITIMKDDNNGSVFGITNIPSITENILPKTIFNIRSQYDCITRFSSENNGFTKSSIQLLAPLNCELSGIELSYLNNSGIFDINMYENSGVISFIRMNKNAQIGILSSGIINDTITIGHSGISKLPVISLKDTTNVGVTQVIASSGYGKIYNLYNSKPYANQYNSLTFMDSSGNVFDLVPNPLDVLDGKVLFTDNIGNTFGGRLSPYDRKKILSNLRNNTSYGHQALYNIISGSGNISIGQNSLFTFASGNNNIVVGRNSASGIITGYDNIVIGNESLNRSDTSGNIIIGHQTASSVTGSYNFVVGNNNIVLLDGKLGPNNSDKRLVLPSNGKLYINNNDDTESLCIKSDTIQIIDSGGSNYPENTLTFKFSGNNSSDLLILNHTDDPLTNSPTYTNAARPFAQLNGDLRLRGAIRFSDNTSLDTSSGIPHATNLAQSGIDLGSSGIALANSGINLINSLFIEGYMPNGLNTPTNGGKTSGILMIKNNNWTEAGSTFVVNRDETLLIQPNAYVIACLVGKEYRPIWVNSIDTACYINP